MAVYPCDFAAHRYREAQQSIYVTLVDQLGPQTHKLRLCPAHFEQVLEIVENEMQEIESDLEVPTDCEKCHKPRTETIFVKAYRLHQEPSQFCLETCSACGAGLTNRLHLANGKPL